MSSMFDGKEPRLLSCVKHVSVLVDGDSLRPKLQQCGLSSLHFIIPSLQYTVLSGWVHILKWTQINNQDSAPSRSRSAVQTDCERYPRIRETKQSRSSHKSCPHPKTQTHPVWSLPDKINSRRPLKAGAPALALLLPTPESLKSPHAAIS